MKIAIVGAGSSYTPELIDGLIAQREALPVSEISLTDINESRLEILGGMTRRMFQKAGVSVAVSTSMDRRRALEGASFVNSLIRVGGMDARINDEKIPLAHGIVGQETTGPGGMMKALRTIPVMLDLARDMRESCPHAWLINYTNPSGIIAEALGKHGSIRYVSLCSGPQGWIGYALHLMGVEPSRASVDWMGLNHLGFIVRLRVDGEDAMARAIESVADRWGFDPEWLRALGLIPATYLRYYYHHDAVVAEYRKPGHRSRGEEVKEIEAELLRQYSDPGLAAKPELLKKRGGGGYSETAMATMRAIHHNTGDRHIVQVLNQGALDDLPEDASVEVSCTVDNSGPHPRRMGQIPLPIRGLIQAVKAYESLTVKAAVERSRTAALQALMAHPLVSCWEKARPLWEDLAAANRPWIPWL